MTKSQAITLIITITTICLAYWYYFALQKSCGFLTPFIIDAHPTFPGMYMKCGLFDIYRFLLTSLTTFTGWSYEFMVDILPLVLWLPIAVVGAMFFYINSPKAK